MEKMNNLLLLIYSFGLHKRTDDRVMINDYGLEYENVLYYNIHSEVMMTTFIHLIKSMIMKQQSLCISIQYCNNDIYIEYLDIDFIDMIAVTESYDMTGEKLFDK